MNYIAGLHYQILERKSACAAHIQVEHHVFDI